MVTLEGTWTHRLTYHSLVRFEELTRSENVGALSTEPTAITFQGCLWVRVFIWIFPFTPSGLVSRHWIMPSVPLTPFVIRGGTGITFVTIRFAISSSGFSVGGTVALRLRCLIICRISRLLPCHHIHLSRGVCLNLPFFDPSSIGASTVCGGFALLIAVFSVKDRIDFKSKSSGHGY